MRRVRVARAGKELGEYTEDQIRLYLASGNLVPGDYGWYAGMVDWRTLSEMGFVASTAVPPPSPPNATNPPLPPTTSPPAPPGTAPIRGIQPRGSYIRESMAPGEMLLFEGHVTWIPHAIIGAFLLLVLAVLNFYAYLSSGSTFSVFSNAIMIAAYIALSRMSLSAIELGVTNRRVIARGGMISQEVIEVRNDKIEGIAIHQSPFGRTFNYGTVIIRGSGQTAVPIRCVSDPLAFRRAVDGVTLR